MAIKLKNHCVLMFSGGRDSTLAAVRLHELGYSISLITVSSDHLVGIESVQRRLLELKPILPPDTSWSLIRQPKELQTDTSFYEKTCLPCHHAYVVVAAVIALSLKSQALGFGYVGYQNGWPEQTPIAVEKLKAVLSRHGIELMLPVYDICSQEEAEKLLKENGLSVESLEQKCVRQVNNINLSPDVLETQVAMWETAIDASVSCLDLIEVNTMKSIPLSEVR